MIVSIGIRTSPEKISYSIVESHEDRYSIRIIDSLIIPKSLRIPEQLKFIRHTFLDIITENRVTNACIRATESNSRNLNLERINIEGVLQELIASSTIKSYFVGQISNITAKLKVPRENFKEFAEGRKVFLDISGWKEFEKNHRESLLAAFSAINL